MCLDEFQIVSEFETQIRVCRIPLQVLCGPGILPGGAVLVWRPLESSVFSTLNRHACISLGKHTGLWMFFVCGLAQPGQLPARAELQSTAGLICLIWSLLNARLPGWLMWAPGRGGLLIDYRSSRGLH